MSMQAGADDFITKPFDYACSGPAARPAAHQAPHRPAREHRARDLLDGAMGRDQGPLHRGPPAADRRLQRADRARAGPLRRAGRVVRYAGVLHDIGKIGVRRGGAAQAGAADARGADRATPPRRARRGDRQPDAVRGDVAPIILAHHENWDGSGYPYGIARRADPARRAHHLRGGRVRRDDQRSSLPPLARSRRGGSDGSARARGTQWDPRVMDVFLTLLAEGHLEPADLPGPEPIVGIGPSFPAVSASILRAA